MKFLIKALFFASILLYSMWGSGMQAQYSNQPSTVVESVGTGSIMYGDVAAARDRAIDDAKRKAVEQTLGTFIDAQTKVENYMLVEDRILNWTRGYIKNYDIISDMKKTPELYEVRMRATVDMSNLANDVQAVENLIQSMGNPRVMILIDEQNIGQSYNKYYYFQVDMTAAETAMTEKFMEKNFDLVDAATVRNNLKKESVMAALAGNKQAAVALAQANAAEVIITGKAIAKVATGINLAGMKSCQANITAKVIDADVGTIIATGSQHAPYPHIDEVTGGTMAIQKAAKKLADDLITKILEKWRKRFYDVNTVKLMVIGIESYKEVGDFKTNLQWTVRGIKNVFQRNVAGGTAELDVSITGNAEQLARDLDQRDVGEYKLKVTGVTANKVSVRVMRAEVTAPAETDTTTIE